MDATITGAQGVNEDILKRATPFLFVLTEATTAQYQGVDSWHEVEMLVERTDVAPTAITDNIIASPELLASLERAIESLEPGKLLTDNDVFGDDEETGAAK